MFFPSHLQQINPFLCKCLFLICLLFVLPGCDDDEKKDPQPEEEEEDTSSLQFTIDGVINKSTVWNDVALTISITHDEDIELVRLSLDGTTVAELTDAPYTYTWDSNTVSDGKHTLAVLVTDVTGTGHSEVRSINVLNTLVSIPAPQNVLEADETGYVFLSDEDGQVIVTEAFTNGTPLTLTSADFDGSTFYLTQAMIDDEGMLSMITLPNISRGAQWVLISSSDYEDEATGAAATASVTFDEVPEGLVLTGRTNNGGSIDFDAENLQQTAVPFLGAGSPFYVLRHDDGSSVPTAYGLYTLAADEEVTLAYNSLQTISSLETAFPTGTEEGDITVKGKLNDYDGRLTIFSYYGYSSDAFTIYYPEEAFDTLYTEIDCEGDNWDLSLKSPKVISVDKAPQYGVDVLNYSLSETQFTYSLVSDKADLGGMMFSANNVFWSYLLPPGTGQTQKMLTLPEVLATTYTAPTANDAVGYVLLMSDQIDSYASLLEFVANATYGLAELDTAPYTYAELSVYFE